MKKKWDNIPDVLYIMSFIVGLVWLYKKNVVTTVALIATAISQILWVVIDIMKFYKERS